MSTVLPALSVMLRAAMAEELNSKEARMTASSLQSTATLELTGQRIDSAGAGELQR